MIAGAFFILLLTHSCREVTSWTMLTTVRPRSNSSSSQRRAQSQQDAEAAAAVPSFVSSDPKQESPSLRPLYESEYTQVLTTISLVPIATQLRAAYDQHFQDPRQPVSF